MRVIAGTAKGRRLKSRPGRETRPTSDKVKEALFSILGNISGYQVLDLFAGSGALGIEALSRGAKECVFIEQDPRAIRIIRENLVLAGVAEQSRVCRGDALQAIKSIDKKFHLILLDPPYFSPFIEKLFYRLAPLQAEEGRTVWEHHSDETVSGFVPFKEKRYGITVLSFYNLRGITTKGEI